MTVRLRLHLWNASREIASCDDCPMFRDPDPRPCYCILDPAVVAGAVVPDNCPLLTMRIEVIERPTATSEPVAYGAEIVISVENAEQGDETVSKIALPASVKIAIVRDSSRIPFGDPDEPETIEAPLLLEYINIEVGQSTTTVNRTVEVLKEKM